MIMRTRQTDTVDSGRRRFWRSRVGWLVLASVLACLVVLVPSAVSGFQPGALVVAEILVAGIVLGLGRQGIDTLALRLVGVSTIVLYGWVFLNHRREHSSVCVGLAGCQGLALGTLFGALVASLFLAVIAVPVTLLWNHGARTLRPEFPRPRTPKQWVIVAICGLALALALDVLLGVPSPP
ncbi:MAG: hypothetical protein DLM59_00470 [Pseudonocardiales bacterium]|nr:MAG: hypothetical protein DLM59_00470 [Pseudonocardiales bacterium]